MITRFIGVSLVVLITYVPFTHGDAPAEVEGRLLQDLRFLTSDACEGRGITTKGIELAAEYIEREFVKAGLKPGGAKGSYYQPFTVTTSAKVGKDTRLSFKGPLGQTITLAHDTHFSAWPQGGSGKASGAVVFAGYGVTSANPKYDDYEGLDVAGKVVMILSGLPRQGHPSADVFAAAADGGVSPHLALRARVENAKKHKAAAVLVVTDKPFAPPSLGLSDGGTLGVPVVFIQQDVADALLISAAGAYAADIRKSIAADLKPRGQPLPGWTCTLDTDVALTQVQVKNVIGVVEGQGPLASQTVVIGAHYDHVGFFGTTRRIGTEALGVSGPGSIGGVGFPLGLSGVSAIHHGADDNASGTAVVLELARRFGALKERQGRRVVFIAFSAEESGLLGSAYYCRQPTFAIAETTTMINMDQVGRLQNDKLMVGGLGSAKSFAALIDKLGQKHGFELSKDLSGQGPSDHSSFYNKNVPVLWFFTGFHEQYHRPSDRVETINVPGLRRIIDLIADAASEVAATPARPEHAKTAGFDRTKTLWSAAPSIGVLPDARDGKGVLVAEVFPKTAAAKAGLKSGDRILALDGKEIPSLRAYFEGTRLLKPGQKVEFLIEREKGSQTIAVELAAIPGGQTHPFFGFTTGGVDFKNGVLVSGVLPGSPAARAGIQKGDRVVAIAGEPIRDQAGYVATVRSTEPGATVVLTVLRGAVQLQISVQAAGDAKKTVQP